DIIHVLEYVWAAATAVFGEQSKLRTPWVRDMLTDLLNSKTQKVIDDLMLESTLRKNKTV
ncbi:MAG: ISKra4 family transposase, partial [bacterium]|nr:ISKra4 family transposase [bacterium]